MRIQRGSYFYRLLAGFFLGGLIPFLLMSFALISVATGALEKTYRARATETVSSATKVTREILSDTAMIAIRIASAPAVVEYAAGPRKSSETISEVHRELASLIGSLPLSPYIIPTDGSPVLSRSPVPSEYCLPAYSGWGILGEISRSEAPKPIVFFAQPHPYFGEPVCMAVGTAISGKKGIEGYVVVDIGKKFFGDRVGQLASSGGALTELIITDHSGCVIYDMADPRREAGFFDPSLRELDGFIVTERDAGSGVKLRGLFPIGTINDFAKRILNTSIAMGCTSVLLFLLMAMVLAQSISRPIHLLSLTMEDVSRGRLDAICPEPSTAKASDEIASLIHEFNSMVGRVNELVENKVEQERHLRYAEIQALQAQINPHFIYNTLNSIRSVAKLKGDLEIAGITTSLARIIREGSSPGSGFCSLEHSLELARDYFAIESWRWPGRFSLDEAISPELLSARMPRLILQPLVENAIFHGLEPKPGTGRLSIVASLGTQGLAIAVRDDGVGIQAQRLDALRKGLGEAGKGHGDYSMEGAESPLEGLHSGGEKERCCGIALINTHRRLMLIYGRDYGLAIHSEPGQGTEVRILIPFESMEE